MKFFSGKSRALPVVGLISSVNSRGLGSETRILEEFFASKVPSCSLDVFKIRAGKASQAFDGQWQANAGFKRWLKGKWIIITVETFMPKLFRYCRQAGVKTIWRPNQEWIDAHLTKAEFEWVDCIIAPQHACADLLESRFGLENVVRIPWITTLPIEQKPPSAKQTTFVCNAGRGGIGKRRNTDLVIDAFAKVLADRSDISFILKTQKPYDVGSLKRFEGQQFKLKLGDTSYRRNLAYYRMADFSVAPSKWEGVGFALLESLYLGTPVLTCDAPPMNEWIAHKVNGYTVPAHLAEVDLPVKFNREQQSELGLNWVRAAQFSQEDLIAGIHWLADNKHQLYERFNDCNPKQLRGRAQAFEETFTVVLHDLLAGRDITLTSKTMTEA